MNFGRAVRRRDFLKGLTSVPLTAAAGAWPAPPGELANDVHTGLNPTSVSRIVRPVSGAEVQALIKDCRKHGRVISVSGSRHAAGGQQFAADSVLLDMRSMNRVLGLDEKSGILQAEAGIEWPELIQGYLALQKGNERWGIRQKQGGADRMTLGGTLSANAHGHTLGSAPIVGDVEWIELISPDGTKQRCSRTENSELFSLAIGGYGLFGVITVVGLRLVPRSKLRRLVEMRTTAEAAGLIERRTAAGHPYGYFQYSIDDSSPDFLRNGILTTYEPVSAETPLGGDVDVDTQTLVSLLQLAHQDRGSAYRHYAKLELEKDGNVEWSDLHQLAAYKAGYHVSVDERTGDGKQGADLIVEVYVPRTELISFLEDARRTLLSSEMPLIYGTVRFIERDKESFLPWAKKRYACVIFCPHTSTDKEAMRKTTETCQQLMRAATRRGGSFYLTYNRFATRDDLNEAYPQFRDFLAMKKKYDPAETLQSEWYRHYRDLYR